MMLKMEEIEGKLLSIKYDAEKWEPPTKDHESLKENALQHIENSLEHDCDPKYLDDVTTILPPFEEWHKNEIKYVLESMGRAVDLSIRIIEEEEKTVNWTKELLKSIPTDKADNPQGV